jgi:hypothetical protein
MNHRELPRVWQAQSLQTIATAILTRDIVQLRRNGYRQNLRDTAQCL